MKSLFRLSSAVALVWVAGCESPSVPTPAASSSTSTQSMEQLNGFDPLPRSFQWSVAERFPVDRDGDGIRDIREDAAYLRPESFDVTLDGCPQSTPSSNGANYVYTWHVKGERSTSDAWQVTLMNRGCRFSHAFPGQGAYQVTLTVQSPSATTEYVQRLVIKDWLIVGLGDSYGSGEGNPDLPGDYPNNHPATWADSRCHRSFKAASALVAQQLEESDPHTSVTYISLACSGANISQHGYDKPEWMKTASLPNPDDETFWIPRGKGLLGPYIGIETPHDGPWQEHEMLPPQVDRLKALIGDRSIDAVLLSAGGNDAGFGDVLEHCIIYNTCHADDAGYRLERFAQKRFNALPGRFVDLGVKLSSLFGAVNVYLTEYPDLSRDQNGETCYEILHNVSDLAGGIRKSQGEIQWIQSHFLTPLNQALAQAVSYHQQRGRPWHYVGGIEEAFRNHGMCAGNDRWFRTPPESRDLQGPKDDKAKTKGMAHPNEEGHRQYARLIRARFNKTFGQHPYYPDGSLLRDSATGKTYVTQGFGRFYIPNQAARDELLARLGATIQDIRELTPQQMSEVPTEPRDGTFVITPLQHKFVIYGGAAFHIPSQPQVETLLESHGLDASALGPIPEHSLDDLAPKPRDGTIFHNGQHVYHVYRSALVHVTDMQQFMDFGITQGHMNLLPTTMLDTALEWVPVGDHTPLRLPLRDGTFLSSGTSKWVMLGGAAFSIQGDHEFNQLRDRQGRPNAPAHALPGDTHTQLPTRPRDNLLIRDVASGKIFILQGGTAFYIGLPAHLDALRAQLPLEDRGVHDAPSGVGDLLETKLPSNHTLLRELDTPEVYLLMGGIKHYLYSFSVFLPMGVAPDRVRLVPPGKLNQYISGNGRLSGHIDGIDSSNALRGWAMDLDSPSSMISLSFFIDGEWWYGTSLGSVSTNVYRPDVNIHFEHLEATGTHGFSLPIPAEYRDGRPHTLYIYTQDVQNQEYMDFAPYTFQL